MMIGKKNVRNRQISPYVRKNPLGKFSILKHLDIPGTEQFTDEIQAKQFFEALKYLSSIYNGVRNHKCDWPKEIIQSLEENNSNGKTSLCQKSITFKGY